jgi:hypothetical protein
MKMKIKEGFLLREIAECYIVVPVGSRVIDFKGLMTLNNSGYFIWNHLIEENTYDNLLDSILQEYEVDEETAKKDLDEFLDKAWESGVLEE